MTILRRTTAIAILGLVAGLVPASVAAADPPQRSLREHTYITYRAPAPPLGSCTAPLDSDSVSAYSLAPWQIASTLPITLSTQNVPSSVGTGAFGAALDGAIAEWEGTQLPSSAFGTVTASSTRPRQQLDGQNMVAFGRIGSAVGITRFWVDASGNVVEFDTLLNLKYPWSTQASGNVDACSGTTGAFDVQAVLTHELGHPIGLEHFDNDVQTMYPFVATGETRKRTLALGDTAGANAKY